MFYSHTPATKQRFFDRTTESRRIVELMDNLEHRRPAAWLALIGLRKVGKTSLILETVRRSGGSPAAVVTDVLESAPVSLDLFRRYALRALDALAPDPTGRSFASAAIQGGYETLLGRSDAVRLLGTDDQDQIFRLPRMKMNADLVTWCLDFPERVALATGGSMVSVWDEFQAIAGASGRLGLDVLATARSAWQRHERVAYVISGSEPTLLRELCTSTASPFFQHFTIVEIGPMAEPDAVEMLTLASEGRFSVATARRIYSVLGGHPFYLQVVGEELLREGEPFDEGTLKEVLQRVLFSRTGRLGLYFDRHFGEVVGRSAAASAVLTTVARGDGSMRLTDIAEAIGAPSGDTVRYIERLGDVLSRGPGGGWRVSDPVFALWVAWRAPEGTAVPMTVLGDEGERRVAQALASMGFDLVYQSRASRGAFDLLATRGPWQLGVQVKRSALPLVFSIEEWRRMEAEALRLGWAWTVAAARADTPTFLDPRGVRLGKTARLSAEAAIVNLPRWLDERGRALDREGQ